jgi:hypothetical protein
MAIFIGALLTLLSIGVVLYPFWKPGAASGPPTPSPDHGPATPDEGPELETIYEAIMTLQLEQQLGNLPQGLYREQLDAYRRQAALALRQQAELLGRDDDRALEQEILLARASLPLATPGLLPGRSGGNPASCSTCGATVGAGLTRCPGCSVNLGPSGGEHSRQ